MLIEPTPIERYEVNGREVWVKREDLCCPPPGPPFSKMRGVVAGLINLKKAGITQVAYAESRISMASWGLSWAAREIGGIEVLVFMPSYKHGIPELLAAHRERWEALGGKTIPIENPTRPSINLVHIKKILARDYPKALLIPVGMPFNETVLETYKQVQDMSVWPYKTLVVSVGSGVICAGLIRGIANKATTIYGVSCKLHKVPQKKHIEILRRAELFFAKPDFQFINLDTKYSNRGVGEAPFPCNPFYDLKAWNWLENNIETLEPPILYWNIGAGIRFTGW